MGIITLTVFPSAIFKTLTISFYLYFPSDQDPNKVALLPYISQYGFGRYVNIRKIYRFLGAMYGGEFSFSIKEIRHRLVVNCILRIPANRFVPRRKNRLLRCLKFLKSFLFRPIINEWSIRMGKQSLIDSAEKKFVYVDKIDKITLQDMLPLPRYLLKKSIINILVGGNVSPQKVIRSINKIFRSKKRRVTYVSLDIDNTKLGMQLDPDNILKYFDYISEAIAPKTLDTL